MPEVGETAPDFELPSHLIKDKKVKLSEFRGKNNVVLAFYPLAWTPV
jgi:peroxiredoxin